MSGPTLAATRDGLELRWRDRAPALVPWPAVDGFGIAADVPICVLWLHDGRAVDLPGRAVVTFDAMTAAEGAWWQGVIDAAQEKQKEEKTEVQARPTARDELHDRQAREKATGATREADAPETVPKGDQVRAKPTLKGSL